MAITSADVKLLREKTGAGMMDCKRALEETGGDMEKAIDYLRKKGAATAEKRAGRQAHEGIIIARLINNGDAGVILEVNCETDFVARSDDFKNFAATVAHTIEANKPDSVEKLLTLPYQNGRVVADALSDLIGKIGEKIEIHRFAVLNANASLIESYTHMGSKIGVLVELAAKNNSPEHHVIARDIAMQIAAMNPSVISREEVKKDTIEHELEIYRQQAKNEGKPDQVVEKIAAGRLEKYFQEVVLLEQSFIKDAAKTIREVLQETSAELNDTISVRRFKRYQLGDEK